MLDRYLTKRPGSQNWQLRVPVPTDLQAAVGRKEVTRSLKTVDRAIASQRAISHVNDLLAGWDKLRTTPRTSMAEDLTISDAQLDEWALYYYEQTVAKIRKGRAAAYAEDQSAYDDFMGRERASQKQWGREISVADFSRWNSAATTILRNRGVASPSEEVVSRFASRLAYATIGALDQENQRDGGDLNIVAKNEVLDRARNASVRSAAESSDIPFSALIGSFMRQWKAQRAGRKETNTEQQKLATFNLFADFCDDTPIRLVTATDAARFYDQLRLFDPSWARSPQNRKLGWHALCTKYSDRTTGLSDATMNRHIDAMKELWQWSSKRGHCEGDNPFDGFFKKLRAGVNVSPYVAWEPEELQLLFQPPYPRQDLLEVMTVAMFTGMRLDEIASLTWSQLRRDAATGISFFKINDAKTPAGIRDVPLHSRLTWLADRTAGKPDDRIWASFNDEGPGKKPGADAGREFSSFKTSRGFTPRAKAFHSFRKTVTRLMERARVPENEWAQIFGHEKGFTYGVYNPDGITLIAKSQVIELIAYPGVDLPVPSGS